jgi:hypothetical protein
MVNVAPIWAWHSCETYVTKHNKFVSLINDKIFLGYSKSLQVNIKMNSPDTAIASLTRRHDQQHYYHDSGGVGIETANETATQPVSTDTDPLLANRGEITASNGVGWSSRQLLLRVGPGLLLM